MKNPLYHASIGLPMEAALVRILKANDLDRADAPVIIESFWPEALEHLRHMTRVRLCMLLNSVAPPLSLLKAHGYDSYAAVYSPEGMVKIAKFADVVGPETELILPRDAEGRELPPTDFVENAHAAGLQVHVWEVNAENAALPVDLRRGDPKAPGYDGALGDGEAQARRLIAAGVDGIFTDYPDIVWRAEDR